MSAGNGAPSGAPDPRPITTFPDYSLEVQAGAAAPPGQRILRITTPVGIMVFLMNEETATALGKVLCAPSVAVADGTPRFTSEQLKAFQQADAQRRRN